MTKTTQDDWITTGNGVHVPLNEREKKKEACNNFFEEKQEEYFKKWGNAPTIELKESELDKYSDIKELRTAATNYFKENLQGKPIQKDGLGVIRVSDKGLEEYMHISADPDKLKAVPQIPELIKRGKLGEFETPHKPRKDNIQGFYPIYANLKTKTGTKKAELLIGKDNEGHLFYQMFLDFDREAAHKKAQKKKDYSGAQDRLSSINIINYFNLFFTPNKENFYKMYATDKKEIDHNDYWYITNNPLSKVGVFPYLGKTISPDLEPNKIYYVYRSEEELSNQEFLDSLKLQPFIDEHTMLGTKPGMELPEDKGIDGTIGADVYYKDGIVYGDIKLYTERIKDEIDNGKKEISMGYFCDYEPQAGEYKGQPYQFKQRNLRVNHVALVHEGRMGADVRVFDNKITLDTIEEIKEMTKINSNPPISALDENIEEITKTDDECNTEDKEIDKRQLIDEVGGILKDKLDEELWRTVMGKLEKIAYNDSENTNNDEDIEVKTEELKEEPVKDEVVPPVEVETEEKQDGKTDVNVSVSMDSMIKEIGQRDALVEAIKPLIGDNSKYKMMSTAQVAKYACDKLDLNVNNGQEVAVLRGYIAATKKQNKVTYSLDNAISTSAPMTDAAFEAYKKGV